jgi:hypothetical protein
MKRLKEKKMDESEKKFEDSIDKKKREINDKWEERMRKEC